VSTIPPPHIAPMLANANPGIEVATINPTKPGRRAHYDVWRGNQEVIVGFTLNDLIKLAYGVQDKQIINGPGWMRSDKFDIAAKPNVAGEPSGNQLNEMVKALLADRFQLKTHTEQKTMSAYILTVAKGGPKMTKNDGKGGRPRALFGPPMPTLRVQDATMDDLSNLMQSDVLDRPVVNRTGLTGHWNFSLHWTPDASHLIIAGLKIPPPSNSAKAPPPLFTAIREQLGLKLGAEKATVPVLVVDHVNHPSAN
jgi:bla regulator protein blaR1